MTDRHRSQTELLNQLDAMRMAVLTLPSDIRVGSSMGELFIPLELFRRKFAGYEVKQREKAIYIQWRGTTYAALKEKPDIPPTSYVLPPYVPRENILNIDIQQMNDAAYAAGEHAGVAQALDVRTQALGELAEREKEFQG
jgi:hypothetical protein